MCYNKVRNYHTNDTFMHCCGNRECVVWMYPGAFPLDGVGFRRYTFLAGSGRSSCPFSIRLRILK